MASVYSRKGLTLLEVLVLLGVILFLLMLLLPAIQYTHGHRRRAGCINNMKELGLGLLNHEHALKRFPPSCSVKRDADGKIVSLDGWSWFVHILRYMPEMVNRPCYERLHPACGSPLDGEDDHKWALGIVIPELQCPDFEGNPYVDPSTKKEAITNYKAFGATHIESLNVASPNPTVPKYAPDTDRHPDGALFPGSTHGTEGFWIDGTSRTAMLVESVEQNAARWTVGKECVVVGLPPVVSFQKNQTYWHPTGYSANRFWKQSTISPGINKTYLDWDYDKFPYDDGGISTSSIKYGPSSHHAGVTNHLFVDGSVHSISNEIDAALYMFIITRNGGDPMPGIQPP